MDTNSKAAADGIRLIQEHISAGDPANFERRVTFFFERAPKGDSPTYGLGDFFNQWYAEVSGPGNMLRVELRASLRPIHDFLEVLRERAFMYGVDAWWELKDMSVDTWHLTEEIVEKIPLYISSEDSVTDLLNAGKDLVIDIHEHRMQCPVHTELREALDNAYYRAIEVVHWTVRAHSLSQEQIGAADTELQS